MAKFSNSDGGGVSPGGNPDSPPESNRPYPREGSESLPELTSFTQRYHYVNGGTINSFTDTLVELPISTAYATEQLPPDWHRLPGMASVPRASVDERQQQHQQYAPDEAGPLSRQQCSMQLQQYQHQRQHDGSTHNLQHHSQPAPPPPFPSSATPSHPSDFRVPTAQFPSSAFAPQWSPQHSQLPASNSDSVAAPLAYAWRTVTPNRTVPQQQLHPSLVNIPHPYATGVSNSGDGGTGSVGGPDRPSSTFSGLSGPPVSSSPSTSSISTVYEQGYHNDFPIVGPYGAVTQQGDRDSSKGWQQHQHLQHQQHHGDQEHYPGQHRTWNPNSWELSMRTETTTTAPIHKREVEFARPSSSTEPASKVPQYPSAFEGSFPLSKSLPAPKDGPIEAQVCPLIFQSFFSSFYRLTHSPDPLFFPAAHLHLCPQAVSRVSFLSRSQAQVRRPPRPMPQLHPSRPRLHVRYRDPPARSRSEEEKEGDGARDGCPGGGGAEGWVSSGVAFVSCGSGADFHSPLTPLRY